MLLRLIRIDFDNLENRQPERESSVGVFTSRKNAETYFNDAPPVTLYLGYDNNFYPKFKLVQEREL